MVSIFISLFYFSVNCEIERGDYFESWKKKKSVASQISPFHITFGYFAPFSDAQLQTVSRKHEKIDTNLMSVC